MEVHRITAMNSFYSTPPLRMARLLFELQPHVPLHLPVEIRGNVLRGAFGTVLQRAVCDSQTPCNLNCPAVTPVPMPCFLSPSGLFSSRSPKPRLPRAASSSVLRRIPARILVLASLSALNCASSANHRRASILSQYLFVA